MSKLKQQLSCQTQRAGVPQSQRPLSPHLETHYLKYTGKPFSAFVSFVTASDKRECKCEIRWGRKRSSELEEQTERAPKTDWRYERIDF